MSMPCAITAALSVFRAAAMRSGTTTTITTTAPRVRSVVRK